jgi:hypothetical protein
MQLQSTGKSLIAFHGLIIRLLNVIKDTFKF